MRGRLVCIFHSHKSCATGANESEGRFELFLDLLYVAILANFAENLAEHVGGDQLAKYIVSHNKQSSVKKKEV